MSKRNVKEIRADRDFVSLMRSIKRRRINNFPEENPMELTDREITRMLKNTSSFEQALREMETLPRRKWN